MIHYPSLPDSTVECLAPTEFLDYEHPDVRAFVTRSITGASNDRERAVALFYAVRDAIRYDPYHISFLPEAYLASKVLHEGRGWCIPKAVLLAACARSVGIPAAIGLADVVNHLTTEKLRQQMGGVNIFYDHGYTALYLNGQWLKAVPAFNIELCERFGVKPTEFDGRGDALYQQYDNQNRLHMEYLADHGTFSDMPLARMIEDFERYYPGMMQGRSPVDADARFENDLQG